MTADPLSVRLVEWNVAMALHTKAHLLAGLMPDIAVLPESAHPNRVGEALSALGATSMQWIGASPTKGLLVAGFGRWSLRIDDAYEPGYQWVLPLHVDGPVRIRMLAVWDMNHRGRGHDSARRLGSCRASMDHYAQFLSGPADLTIISGDFNNSVYWDKPGAEVKFGDFMDGLRSRGFVSAYHHRHGCAPGAEPDATLWWTRNVEKPYHVDYTFVSPAAALGAVTIGTHIDWLAYSDHGPMTVDLKVAPTPAPTHQENRMTGNHRKEFPLAPDEVDDMVCGNNGHNLTQLFRPSYVTAAWDNGVLVEVKIWGRRVLQDGSLGIRMLDHYWGRTQARGPIRCRDLPVAVADRLRSYAAEHGLGNPDG